MKFIKPTFLGMIAGGGALVIELLVSGFFPENFFPEAALSLNIIFPLLAATAIEEFFKLLVIYKSFYLQKNSAREFLYSSLFLGFGFSLAEIAISNYFNIFGDIHLYWGILGIIFIHTLSAGLIGWLLLKVFAKGSPRFDKASGPILIIILLIATLFHFSYNTVIISDYLQK